MAYKSTVKRVAVIGAGPAGLAAAKYTSTFQVTLSRLIKDCRYLEAEKWFSEIHVFEQRETVGGVWCATPDVATESNFTIPRTVPTTVPNQPVWRERKPNGRFEFVSPVYDNLDTNIPYTLMNFSDHSFPEGSPIFPQHTQVREYLERYADDIRPLLRLGTQVLDVVPVGSDEKWKVTTRRIAMNIETSAIYDAVVVASGHYDDPFIPNITGIGEFNKAFPGVVSHSKYYRRPHDYENKVSFALNHESYNLTIVYRKSS